MSRIHFALADLEREIRSIIPSAGEVEVVLPVGTFGPVAEELASHYGQPLKKGTERVRCGMFVLRRGTEAVAEPEKKAS